MSNPYELAILPCTKAKNPQGTTARTLYTGGVFPLMMRHAQQRADKILILSGKYGLIELDHHVSWYEAWLPELDPEARKALAREVQLQLLFYSPKPPVISYLPRAYHDFFRGVNGDGVEPGFTADWIYRRPFAKVAFTRYFVTFYNEIKSYGISPHRR